MIRWVVAIFIVLTIFAGLLPWLEKIGMGRLPGDFRFKILGRIFLLPFGSTIFLSALAFLLAYLFR